MKKIFTLVMLCIFTVMNVNAEETTLWTGTHAVDWGNIWEDADGTITSQLKANAAAGTVLRLYVERTDFTPETGYAKGCATIFWHGIVTGTDEDHGGRGDIEFGAETTVIEFVLNEKSLELLGWDNAKLQVVGHGFNLLKIAYENASPITEETEVWTGTHAVDWGSIWEDDGTVTNKLKTLTPGYVLRLYVERTDFTPETGYAKGCATISWHGIETGTDEDHGGRGEIEIAAETKAIQFVLNEKSFELFHWDNAKLQVVGHGFNLTKITIDVPGSTGINAVAAAQKNDGRYYNLAGQLVQNPTKGLYIVNGKKVLFK